MRCCVALLFTFLMLAGVPAVVRSQVPAPHQQEQTKEQTVYVTKTGKKYHRATCRYLSRSKISISLKDAKAKGYTPCSVCKPPE